MQSVSPKNRHITILTKAFLGVHWDRNKPLLLGFSGGPDSKALLYALLECGVKPTIAHVDHGWREESREEARQIEQEANQLDCPFVTTRLTPKEFSEDEARRERFAFFAKQASTHAALLLAHQADDLAETVLKRLLEGAALTKLGGMQEVSEQYGMSIWRPFLRVGRDEILEFLEARSLLALQDSSNHNPIYLRARMRQNILPLLGQHFGKEVKKNLTLLSERSYELKKYLDRRVSHIPKQKGPWGTIIDLSGTDPMECCHIIQNLLPMNRDQMAIILTWVQSGAKSKQLQIGDRKIFIDGGRIWMISESISI